MKIQVEITKGIVEKWCEMHGYSLTKHISDDDIKPLSRDLIRYDGINGIIVRVCSFTGITTDQIQKKTRKREIVIARQLAHTIAKKHTTISLTDIGIKIGGKDHALVLYSIKTIKNLIKTDKAFRSQYDELIKLYSL